MRIKYALIVAGVRHWHRSVVLILLVAFAPLRAAAQSNDPVRALLIIHIAAAGAGPPRANCDPL